MSSLDFHAGVADEEGRRPRGREAAERLAQRLGSFNDLSMDLYFLKKAMKMNSDSKTKEMQSLHKAWRAEKRKLKKQIVNSLTMPDLFKVKA